MLAADRPAVEPESTLDRIAAFLKLPPDWDSYGANAPSVVAVTAAQRFVRTAFARYLPNYGSQIAPYWVAPIPNGGIQIDWRGPNGEIEVDVDPSGKFGYLLQEGTGDASTAEEANDVPLETVLGLLAKVLDRARSDRV